MKYAVLLLTLLLVPAALAQTPSPTPMRPAPKPAYDPNAPKPAVRYQPAVQGGWQRFKDATRCEQVGNSLTCDNGYKQTVR